VIQPRGPLSTRRATAHWVVLAAAALTTLVAAACGAALAVFAGQALPLAVRHELSVAPSTALSATGSITNGRPAATASALRTDVGRALRGVPFTFWSGTWSDPLDFVPGSLPARPASGGKHTPLLEAAALSGITSHAILVSGHWPAAPAAGQVAGSSGARSAAAPIEIPAALPVSAAALLHVSPGDALSLKDTISSARVSFLITGLFAERGTASNTASYWALDTLPASGSASYGGYITYGPLVVSPAAFAPLRSSSAAATTAPLTARTGTWLAQPDMAKFSDTDLSAISAAVSALRQALAKSAAGIQLSSSLTSILSGTASNLSVARSLLVIMALQLIVLALAALLAVARLLASQREDETALIAARGATRWQLVRLTAAEVIPLCASAAVVGALAGIRLAGLLAAAGPLRTADVKLSGPAFLVGAGGTGSAAGTWLDAVGAALVIMVLAIIAMLGPVLGSGPAATEARVRRGRQATIVGATRAGADIALIVLAVLAGWQLRRYSADSGANTTIDPVLVLAPALALAGGTVVTLRLLPAAARAGDRLAGRGRRLIASLAGWQVSRLPLRQGGAALLLVMATATGTLALAQHASWIRSAHDQGSFIAGADARVDTPYPLTPGATGRITNAPGVKHAMAVFVQPQALPAEVLAINAPQARSTVRIRADQVSGPTARLFDAIAPKSPPGTPIPGRPSALTLTAALTAEGTAVPSSDGAIPFGRAQAAVITHQVRPVTVMVTVADSTGDMYQLSMGTLPPDGREHVLTASLGGTHVDYPLRLVQISLSFQMPRQQDAALALTVTGPALKGWQAGVTSPAMESLENTFSTVGNSALPESFSWQASRDTATFTFSSGFGLAQTFGAPQPVFAQVALNAPGGSPTAPLPAIATSTFADANDLGPGSVFQGTVNGLPIPLLIVAVVKSFPTVTASTGALIVDLPAAEERVVSQGAPPLAVTEWWLSTTSHRIPPGLPGALPPGSSVTGAAEATAALIANPLSAAPQQALLALAAAAALLAITGFWVSIAANVRQRRAETALLAALGISNRSAALQLCLEKLMLSVPSAALGLIVGTVVARLLVPAVTLTAAATQPIPPPITLFDLAQTLPLAAGVAIIPALATALTMIRRPDPAAELRAAEAA
jgi:ABC-type antimicrobial peptide transport system permease subunit